MPPKYFPLRWESTGDQWWFASPLDWAAANGHYDLVKALLQTDSNLLIKLTSLSRIRRLETVWDDSDENFNDVAKGRSQIAQKLLEECERKKGYNSLIRAGYGGWLLYTAASAGDLIFVKELLGRDPLLVFGEGEYGVTDMFYAAARSKNREVFNVLFECSVKVRGREVEVEAGLRWEMMNRAVHAAARGGDVVFLREEKDVFSYRDAHGFTVLHSASARGRVEVVKTLISSYSYDIINSTDNEGNTALHVAAHRGHLSVAKVLISTSASLASLTNNHGDTFVHMAVAGFAAPSFRRLDRQVDFMRHLVTGNLIKIEDIVNVQNNDGRTPLHLAVTHNIQSDIAELLLSVRYIDVNIRDDEGNTPLDLLKQQPISASSEILIKRMISAGGITTSHDQTAVVSHVRMHGIGGCSPGTSFRIPDADLFLHVGSIEDRFSSDLTSYNNSGEIEATSTPSNRSSASKVYKRLSSLSNATRRFKALFRWASMKDKSNVEDYDSVESYRTVSSSRNSPVPLRQQFSRLSTLPSNKRILSLQGSIPPSPSSKKMTHRAGQVLPKSNLGSPLSPFSESSWSCPMAMAADRRKSTNNLDDFGAGPSSLNQSPDLESVKMKRKYGSFNLRSMNNYLCFGGQGLAAGDSHS